MDEPSETRSTLVLRLRDPADHQAWGQFVDLYCPLIRRFLTRHGLQDADAEDVVQEVFRTVSQSIGGFEHRSFPGSFRGWLRKIACCRLHEFVVARERQAAGSGDTAVKEQIEQCPASQEHDPSWEQEYYHRALEWAAEQVRGQFREKTWQAFWRTAVDREKPEDTARTLQMSVGAVYIARSRVFAKLQQVVREIDEEVRGDVDPEGLTR